MIKLHPRPWRFVNAHLFDADNCFIGTVTPGVTVGDSDLLMNAIVTSVNNFHFPVEAADDTCNGFLRRT